MYTTEWMIWTKNSNVESAAGFREILSAIINDVIWLSKPYKIIVEGTQGNVSSTVSIDDLML